jgi:hypothetical protein
MNWRSATLLTALVMTNGCTVDLFSDAGRRKLDRVSMRVDALDFEVVSRGEVLWTSVAKVSRMRGASYSVEADEASGSDCPFNVVTPRNAYELTFTTQKAGGNANDPDAYSFDASIERSDLGSDCRTLARTRSSVSRQYVRMRRGQSIKLLGEDDFRVIIRRR